MLEPLKTGEGGQEEGTKHLPDSPHQLSLSSCHPAGIRPGLMSKVLRRID